MTATHESYPPRPSHPGGACPGRFQRDTGPRTTRILSRVLMISGRHFFRVWRRSPPLSSEERLTVPRPIPTQPDTADWTLTPHHETAVDLLARGKAVTASSWLSAPVRTFRLSAAAISTRPTCPRHTVCSEAGAHRPLTHALPGSGAYRLTNALLSKPYSISVRLASPRHDLFRQGDVQPRQCGFALVSARRPLRPEGRQEGLGQGALPWRLHR